MARKTGEETPAARKAYLDYEAMGDQRTIEKLHQGYSEALQRGEGTPTRQLSTLYKWSSQWHWQDRIKAFDEAEAERGRRERAKRMNRHRDRILLGVEAGTVHFLKRLDNGEVELIEDAGDLATATKLYFQVAGEPLADRQEHTGANGGPVQVQTIPLPVFGPQDPLNHFGEEAPSDDDQAEDDDDG
jgi:hypothetical protein